MSSLWDFERTPIKPGEPELSAEEREAATWFEQFEADAGVDSMLADMVGADEALPSEDARDNYAEWGKQRHKRRKTRRDSDKTVTRDDEGDKVPTELVDAVAKGSRLPPIRPEAGELSWAGRTAFKMPPNAKVPLDRTSTKHAETIPPAAQRSLFYLLRNGIHEDAAVALVADEYSLADLTWQRWCDICAKDRRFAMRVAAHKSREGMLYERGLQALAKGEATEEKTEKFWRNALVHRVDGIESIEPLDKPVLVSVKETRKKLAPSVEAAKLLLRARGVSGYEAEKAEGAGNNFKVEVHNLNMTAGEMERLTRPVREIEARVVSDDGETKL